MKLFIDASVALAAAGQATGASRAIFDAASTQNWELQASHYVLNEVAANVIRLSAGAEQEWERLRRKLILVRDLTSFEFPAVFSPGKDRPILFTAAGWSDVLLTLDRRHFGHLFGVGFYSLRVSTRGDFLENERTAGRYLV